MKPNTVSRHQNIPNPASYRAFTLVELVVVIAILALLAAMSLPALCKTNIKSHGLQCLSNLKSLTAAWTSWSSDNNDRLLDSRAWVGGTVNDPSTLGFIDQDPASLMRTQPLNTYLRGNVKVYKCPSDSRTSTITNKLGTPVCRSVAMNCYMGIGWDITFLVYKKMSDFNRPGPPNTFVFADESPLTINDGFFAMPMTTYDPLDLPNKAWVNVPAAYHSNSGNLSFADGHVELHMWNDERTLTAALGSITPGNLDLDWLQSKSSAKINNPTR
jgi:prepilin-type N-terminal cleavage/methylation domain-containing protein/prepilin-type processing-associated H-X9-DG protein